MTEPASMGETNTSGASMQLTPGISVQTPSTDTRVSVIIPLYNHENYIEAALQSVFAQSLSPMEIIVIDDGSVDASAEKVRRLCQDHPEIIFWSWPNQGAHHTLNAAILRATGDFVAILNSDDCYHQERLAACLATVQADPRIDVVATGMTFIDNHGNDVANPWYENAMSFFKREGDISLGLVNANFLVTTSNLFIRRSIFERIGYFSPLRYTHDLEFCLRLILGKGQLHFLDRPLLAYRLHGKNTISENKVRGDIERAAVFAFFLYRQWQRDETSRTVLEKYVEVLGEQDILKIVEDFLALLDGKRPREDMLPYGIPPTEFLGFLSQLGVDWVTHESDDPLLTRFVSARKDYLDRQKAGGEPRLITKLKADNQWLIKQRDAWEKAARTQEEQVKAMGRALETQAASWAKALEDQKESWAQAMERLHADNAWLLEQRDAWEKTANDQEDQVKSLKLAIEEMGVGKAWLLEQRDGWEKAARAREEQTKSLNLAIEDMRRGNEWLLGQRDAWEQAAARSAEELAKYRATVQVLLESRLFRILVRIRLLKLTNVPLGSVPLN